MILTAAIPQNEESFMKRRICIVLTIISVLLIAALSGCSSCDNSVVPPPPPPPPPETKVSITASVESLTIPADKVEGYNFAALFEIVYDGSVLAVLPSYIDSGSVKAEPGEYSVSCSYKDKSASVKVIVTEVVHVEITSVKDAVTIESYEAESYDFTALFDIKVNGKSIDVTKEHIDSSAVKASHGEYTVVCSYGAEKAEISVTVTENVYTLSALESEIAVSRYIYDSYDFKELFSASVNGAAKEITDDMVTTDVKNVPGEYTYTVKLGNKTASVKIVVTDKHDIEIINSYKLKEIPIGEVSSFDFTTLFTVYVDMKQAEITDEMVDATALASPEEDKTYSVTLDYEYDGTKATASATVKVVADLSVAVTTKNVDTYPNAGTLDLTTLFEIVRGGEKIPVTYDMLSGTVDYSREGVNTITLSYAGQTYTAEVNVIFGVVINYAHGDTITIKKGTNKSTYSFGSDFIVTINGIRYGDVERCVDAGEVDFGTVGEYKATITVKYNTEKPSIFDIKFKTFTKTITYNVVETEYSLSLNEETVRLAVGTESYNVFSNVRLSINGINQSLTDSKTQAELINACYAEVVSDALDFTSDKVQTVEIKLYVYGTDEEPITVSYDVIVESDIVITPSNIALFGSSTIYTADLFEITENGVPVTVTQDMVSGYVNTFKSGVYNVTAEYKGATATSRVVVYGSDIVGRYKTALQKIESLLPPDDDNDDDSGNEYWGDDSDAGEYSVSAYDEARTALNSRIGDLVVYADGRITLHGKDCTDVQSIDEHTLSFMYYSNRYTMYYSDGVAVLLPENSVSLGYNEYKRPMTYFNTNRWLVPDIVIINYSSSHVLTLNYESYSIDVCELMTLDGTETKWYGLKTRLSEKTSTDTVYEVSWGEVEFAPNFQRITGLVSSLEMNGETFSFTMTDTNVGKVNTAKAVNPYVGRSFRGTVDGQSAELRAINSGYSYSVNGNVVFSSFGSSFDISNYMINGGIDLATNILTLNCYKPHDNTNIMSYRFKLDLENNTFELLKRDDLFGRYENSAMAIFLDGYGSGCVQFDKTSSIKTVISYSVSAGELTVRYLDTGIRFPYGEESKFYVSALLNTLTVKEFVGLDIVGTTLENIVITDGAIVHIKSFTIGAGTAQLGKTRLWEAFEIIDKNGVWTNDDKSDTNKFDTSKVSFGTPGFYQLILRIPVGGVNVESYYSIQVLGEVQTDSPVISISGVGVIYSSASLLMDSYGRAFVTYSGSSYVGSVTVSDDDTFVIKAFNSKGEYLYGLGSLVADGLICVRFGGAMQFSDYFTIGTTRVIGGSGLVLREFTYNNVTTYMVGRTASSLGEKATLEIIEGASINAANAILKITSESGSVYHVRVNSWGNATDGLVVVNI